MLRKQNHTHIWSSTLYKALFDQSAEGQIILNIKGEIISANKKICKLLEYTETELIGRNITSLNPQTINSDKQAHLIKAFLKTEETSTFVADFKTKSGSIFIGEVISKAIELKQGSFVLNIFRDISDRIKAEEALALSRESYSDIFNSVSEAIYIQDEKGVFIEVNKGAEKMYGYTNKELVGKNPMSVAAPGRNNIDAIAKQEEQVFLTGKTEMFDFWAVRKNGEVFLKEVIVNKGRYFGKDVLIATARDITLYHKVREELKQSEEDYRGLFEGAHDAIIIFAPENEVVLNVNQSACDLYGFSREEFIGMSLESISENVERGREYVQKTAKMGCFFHFETIQFTKDKGKIHLDINASIIQYKGKNAILSINRDVTARNAFEKKLSESEELFRTLYNNLPGGMILIDSQYRIKNVNPQTCKITGYGREELVGSLCDIICPKGSISKKCPIWEGGIDCFEGMETAVKCKNGTLNPVLKNAKTVYIKGERHILEVFQDTKQQKESEIAISQSEQKYRTLYNNAPLAYQSLDNQGKIIDINPAWLASLGYDREEVIGRLFSDFLHPDCHPLFSSSFPEFKKHGTLHDLQFKLIKKDGSCIYVSYEGCIGRLDDGAFDRTYCTFKNITEERLAKKELIRAKEKAEESDRLKSAFLANMSHEIRTPMNGILGFANLLKESRLNVDAQQKYIDVIEKSGTRMLNIINDLISISKIEADQVELFLSEVNLTELFDYLFVFFKPETERKNITLVKNKAENDNRVTFFTDKEKIYAVLINLIKNAIKYTNKGTIEFGYKKDKDSVLFYVKDTGIGIDKEKQQQIFDRFVQADTRINRPYEGAGLGLSITKAYVDLLKGKIWVQSEKGIGSAFFVEFPAVIPHDANINTVLSNDDFHGANGVLLRRTILIVDDDETAQFLLSEMLQKKCKKLLFVNNGIEAVELCKSKTHIDLILMDVKMSEMDGFEATRSIKLFNPKMKIIAQTAYALDTDREKALQAGCDDYLAKPYSQKELVKSIVKTLNA